MDIGTVEKLIMNGLARTVRAQQLAGPAESCCLPSMVDEKKRRELIDAHHDLSIAAMHAKCAYENFAAAAAHLGGFIDA